MTQVLDKGHQILFFSLLSLRGRLRLRSVGMRGRGSDIKAARQMFGIPGRTNAQAYRYATAMVDKINGNPEARQRWEAWANEAHRLMGANDWPEASAWAVVMETTKPGEVTA